MTRFACLRLCALGLFLSAFCGAGGQAQTSDNPGSHAIQGPKTLPLGANIAQLHLPQNFIYLDKSQTNKFLMEQGDKPEEGSLGLVAEENDDWFALLRYDDIGYVKDDEASSLNGDTLLNEIRTNTEKSNEERRQKGAATMQVVGWYQAPSYNNATHTLSWAVIGKESSSPNQVINYTSIVFGRHGIMDTTVVGDYAKAATLRPKLAQVNGLVNFQTGEDYASFRRGDRMSDLTMTGLITGGAAATAFGLAKTGLLAKLGKFLVIGLAAIGAALKKLWDAITNRRGERVNTTYNGPKYPGT